MTVRALKRTWVILAVLAAGAAITPLFVGACGPAPPASEVTEAAEQAGVVVSGWGDTVKEVETEHLICGVLVAGSGSGISCVPKIPGLFDEPPAR